MKTKGARVALRCALASVVAMLALVSSVRAAGKYQVVHYFTDSPAAYPLAGLIADSDGNLYGVAGQSNRKQCHASNCGAVFRLAHQAGGRWTFSILRRFKGPDGDFPEGSLIFDSSGNLYGTTFGGGANTFGTVFEVSPSGNGWKEKVLYSFGGSGDDLIYPSAALTWDTSGNLYGTAMTTETGGYGGVFELKRSGNQWKEKTIHAFTGSDGANPASNLVWDSAGNLYGTTVQGGRYNEGVVFELKPTASGRWKETVLYNFPGGVLGAYPYSGLILDTAGNLYGTTYQGGVYTCGQFSCGTVFKLKPSRGNWSLSIVHAFNGSDGDNPWAGVTFDSAGNLYGTTISGGRDGYGVVFKLSQSGRHWTETLLHSLDGKNGSTPYGGLIFDRGVLYGTAWTGGIGNAGVVFSLTP